MNLYPPGSLIAARYEVASRPLLGGMGIVYLCYDHGENRPVALKTFKPEYLPDRAARDRFLREGDIWMKLERHPNIVHAYNVVHAGDGIEVYLVLELIAKEQGRQDASLRSWLTPGQLMPPEQAMLFATQVIRGMQFATERIPGFVHRDLKPENLLIGSDKLSNAAINRLRVTDLGLASVLEKVHGISELGENDTLAFGRAQLTRGIVGTPLYMAPEQWRSRGVSVATDIYALGGVVFEMLAGERAVSGSSLSALERGHLAIYRKLLSTNVPVELRAWVERCLRVAAEERFASWADAEAGLAEAYVALTGRQLPNAETAEEMGREERIVAGWAQNALGASYLDIGRIDLAGGYFAGAIEAAKREGGKELESAALCNLGSVYSDLGEPGRAIDFLEQALAISRELRDRYGEGQDLNNLGLAYADLGDFQRAIGYYQESLAIAREIGDFRGEGKALGNLGTAYATLGEMGRAVGYYEQRLEIARSTMDRHGQGTVLGNLGLVYAKLGEVPRAFDCYEQHLAIAREIGDVEGEANASFNIAYLYREHGETAKALPFARQALSLFRQIGSSNAQVAAKLLAVLEGHDTRVGFVDEAKIREQFRQVIEAVVAAATGNKQAKAAVEEGFSHLEQGGFRVVEPIKQIWQGERNESKLIRGLDETDAFIVREILAQLNRQRNPL